MDICCADVFSISVAQFGWALPPDGETTPNEGTDITALAESLTERLERGRRVVLGFECTRYVPLHEEPMRLTKARRIDGNRSWSAGAGTAALATGLVEATRLLHKLNESGSRRPATWIGQSSWNQSRACSSGTFTGSSIPETGRPSMSARDRVTASFRTPVPRATWKGTNSTARSNASVRSGLRDSKSRTSFIATGWTTRPPSTSRRLRSMRIRT